MMLGADPLEPRYTPSLWGQPPCRSAPAQAHYGIFEDEDLDGVVRNMGRNKRLAGIVGPGDVALSAGKGETDAAASAAPGPGGSHAPRAG